MISVSDVLNSTHCGKLASTGIRVILDYVPDYTSDENEWFKMSEKEIEPYTDYYTWDDGKVQDGINIPPNGWVSRQTGTRATFYLTQTPVVRQAPYSPDIRKYDSSSQGCTY